MRRMVAAICLLAVIGCAGVAAAAGVDLKGEFDFESDDFGLFAGTVLNTEKQWRVAPDVGYYFDSEDWAANVNAIFAFPIGENSNLYGLGGVNFLFANDTDVGVNLGAGTDLDVGKGRMYLEGKYTFASRDGFAVILGMRF